MGGLSSVGTRRLQGRGPNGNGLGQLGKMARRGLIGGTAGVQAHNSCRLHRPCCNDGPGLPILPKAFYYFVVAQASLDRVLSPLLLTAVTT